ncbi:hypothetical protein FHR22_000303 [Sphingopyxis panaciterrae]|uniref:hypothetical protein n=1 Tax=Sphingopyxis panaciterrae TaxID=363841 RepID=UPI00142361DB|nr:hypothetical protein [Sphingopyxis panaciterrae]NIJ35654.1 hypothetical protein [Sphingopyxis panaciterrae]
MMQARAWTIAAVLLGAAPGGNPARAEEARRPVATHEAARVLVGNTLVYTKADRDGDEETVYFRLDGSGLAATRGEHGLSEARPIIWATMSDGQFCVADSGRKIWDGDCGTLSIDGDAATLAPANGPAWSGKLLAGDARHLDPATAGQQRLDGEAAIRPLTGNTLVFIPMGGRREYLAFHFLADGTVRRAQNDEPDFDNWVLHRDESWSIRKKDGALCLRGGEWKQDYCAAITVTGDLVALKSEGAGLTHGRLLPGDARNLSPAAAAATKAMMDRLTGHTLLLVRPEAVSAKKDVAIYFQRGGVGQARERSGGGPDVSKPVKWLLQPGGKLCVVDDGRKFGNGDCAALSIEGELVVLEGQGRPKIAGRLLRGKVALPKE